MALAPLSQTVIITANGTRVDLVSAVTVPPGTVMTPTLAALSLSGSLQMGVVASGSILGATAGSSIVSNIPGVAINSALRTYSGTPTGSAQTIANGLVETLAGATGSPKSSSIVVAATPATLGALTLSSAIATVGTARTINIFGATAGSTITGTPPDGMALDSAARTISGTPLTAGDFTFSLVETLAGAAGSPRSSSATVTVATAYVPSLNFSDPRNSMYIGSII